MPVSLAGCSKWKPVRGTGIWERLCGRTVAAAVQPYGVRKFEWIVYEPGVPGSWSKGTERTPWNARRAADDALRRYGSRR